MTLLALGINHLTAPLALRERVAFAPEHLADSLRAGQNATRVDEIAILSTCNRTELYVDVPAIQVSAHATSSGSGAQRDADEIRRTLLTWLADYQGIDGDQLQGCHYFHTGQDALRHLMKVAAGLDSMVLGEPQILGQMKAAYAAAQRAGTLCGPLDHCFQQVFATAKRVRTETAIGENPVSVAYAAVSLAQRIFTNLAQVQVLLIGAGDTVELVARHLRDQGVGGITVANRTLARAQTLACACNATAIVLADIPDHLHRADIVISSTASQLPVLGKGAVESALKQRKHRPMLMVDIAVPRDIEAEVAQLDDVYLYTVDDLHAVIEVNRRTREDAVGSAAAIIDADVANWQQQLRALDAVDTIRAFRASLTELRDAELHKALQALARGQTPDAVMRQLANNLTNKLLHTPTARLKQAGAEGRREHILWARELFDLGESPAPESK